MKATLKKALARDGWYDYEKGTVFTVIQTSATLTLVEDGLGFKYWLNTKLFDFSK